MIPALVCRPLQYPDLTMAKAAVHQLRVVSQPRLRVHCHSLSAAGYSCQRWKMSPSCWQHWHWQKSPCRAHSQLSNRMSTPRADSENHRRWQNRSRAQGLTMQWPEQDQRSQNQHSLPAAGLRALRLVLESVWEGVLVLGWVSVSASVLVLELVSESESLSG